MHARVPQVSGMKPMTQPSLALDRLLELRLVVARFGEMDNAKWWNTKGQLGRLGAATLRRGFPRTHYFAQARSVFAVAAHRCTEVFAPPRCVTLWHLSEAIEEEFDARWDHWLDQAASFNPFFEKLAASQGADLRALLLAFEIVNDRSLAIAHGLEGVFWVEVTEGKWKARPAPTRSVEELVRERTSAAVKASLKSLAEASVGGGGAKRGRKSRTHD